MDPQICSLMVMVLAISVGGSACIALRAARGWRTAIVFAAFLPALLTWSLLLLIAAFLALVSLGLLPPR